jgi:hypothetical protein
MKKNRKKELAKRLDQLKDQLADLRDSKWNPCDMTDDCPCYRFDQILDLLENLKEI